MSSREHAAMRIAVVRIQSVDAFDVGRYRE